MYKQMYEGIVEILKQGPEDEVKYMRDIGKVPYFFNLVYRFDPTDIIRIKRIEIDGMCDIMLVLAKFPDEAKHAKYADYIMYEGKFTKVILINMNDLLDEDPMTQMLSIGWSIWKMTYTVVETYINIFEKNEATTSAVNVFYYSTAVLIIKVLDKLYHTENLTSDIVSLVINKFYKSKILPIGVESIRKAINEIDIEMLLDYNLWDAMLSSPTNYPGAAFADYNPQEVLETVDKLNEEIKMMRDKDEENTTDSI